jgi:hypothetical protein
VITFTKYCSRYCDQATDWTTELREPSTAVGIATRLRTGQPRNFDSTPVWCKRFSLLQNVQTGSGAHSEVPGALFPGVKRPGREVDHVPPPSAVVKNAWSYRPTSTPSRAFMVCRGTTLNLRSRCAQKQLSYLNKNWNNSTNVCKIIQCEISWESVRRFSCRYMHTDGRTARS